MPVLKISKGPTPWGEGNRNWRRTNTLHCQATGE